MMIAQKLYEGIKLPKEGSVGLITYMRTDSVNLSSQITKEARDHIKDVYGADYLPEKVAQYKSKKGAQEAHEAIRPTGITRTPDDLKGILDQDQFRLYRLIWRRTLASQMNPEILNLLRVDIKAGEYTLRANGKQVKFDGFSRVYLEGTKSDQERANKEVILPELTIGDNCKLKKIIPEQKFTQPPARFSEASLIKTLEENGIGRPSTYAPTISTLKDRRYVISEKRYLIPEEIGFIVNDLLVKHFPEIVDIEFTAKIEQSLDSIAEGKEEWKKPVKDFWIPFAKEIKNKEEEIEKINTDIETDLKCEKCGRAMLLKEGRFGKFYACSGFPDCKKHKTIPYKNRTKMPRLQQG